MGNSWEVIFFETSRGEKVVKEFIKSLDSRVGSKITGGIDLLEKHGPLLGMPYSKKLTKDLHELRIRGKTEIRVIYGVISKTIYLLHVFKKQTQKTPLKEIQTAESRFRGLKVS